MTGRDPAADARTIAKEFLRDWASVGPMDIEDILDDGETRAELSNEDLTAIRAKLREIVDRLQLALHPDTRIEHNDPWAPEHQRRLVTPWQPAPTTDESREDTHHV